MVKIGIPSNKYQNRQGSLGNVGTKINFQAYSYGTSSDGDGRELNGKRDELVQIL